MDKKNYICTHNRNKMSGLSLWVFPKRYKINKTGKAPLFIRISLNRERAEIALKRFIDPNLWDNNKQIVKGRSPETASINEQIRIYKLSLYDHFTRLINEGRNPSAKTLKEAFEGVGSKGKTLIEAFTHHNERMKKQVGKDYAIGTYKRYETCLMLIKEFLKYDFNTHDISLNDLKLDAISGFDYYLRTIRKCNNNTTIKYLKNLRKVINQARAFEWMSHDPYLNYKAKLEPVNREILTQNEIDALISKDFSIQRLEYIRDIFVFCCFSGLAYSDVKKLSTENLFIGIDGNMWIQVNRTKTNVLSKIPVLPIAEMLIEKYKNNPECVKAGKLFPVPSNQKFNSYLKEVADCCGINKTLTSHIARHTFATTVTLNNKVPIETVSKMLGHRSIKTTETYSKVLEVKISDDMIGLREKFKAALPLKVVNEI